MCSPVAEGLFFLLSEKPFSQSAFVETFDAVSLEPSVIVELPKHVPWAFHAGVFEQMELSAFAKFTIDEPVESWCECAHTYQYNHILQSSQ